MIAQPSPARIESVGSEPSGLGKRLRVVGGCLLGSGLVMAALLLVSLSWWSNMLTRTNSPAPLPSSTAQAVVKANDDRPAPTVGIETQPTRAALAQPTRAPALPTDPPPALVPAEVIGNWVISNQLGVMGYSFFRDGRFKRALKSVTGDGNCTSTYEEIESGMATFENGILTLTISAGERHVSDTCGRDERTAVEARTEQYPWYLNSQALNIDNTDFVRHP